MEKKSEHLVDPELKEHLNQFRKTPLNAETLHYLRDNQTKNKSFYTPEHLPVNMTERTIPGLTDAPDVRIIIFTPTTSSSPKPVYLSIHGGGNIMGAADLDNEENAKLAVDLDCVVVAVDYRLAPETKHPGALEDTYATLSWIYNNYKTLDIDKHKIAIGGSSAGAGHATRLGLYARDNSEINIMFQYLEMPMLDDRTCINDVSPYAGEYIWDNNNNYLGWSSLLGHEPGINDVSPYAVPERAEDLSALPPTLIIVGALDLFLDESMNFSQRLIHAGVPTELHVYPGAYHDFKSIKEARISKSMQEIKLAAMRRAFYG
jgi:acetyl esterase/lipase